MMKLNKKLYMNLCLKKLEIESLNSHMILYLEFYKVVSDLKDNN
jgi:hypothetical protein